jgi:hypothetical protein
MGIIQLHRGYGPGRLDKACKIAIEADACSYHRIQNILKNNMDKMPVLFEDETPPNIKKHENIRGNLNYK